VVRTVCANREQGGGQREVRAQHLDEHRGIFQGYLPATIAKELAQNTWRAEIETGGEPTIEIG